LETVAYEFPELTIVAGHLGYPWTEETISLARKYENVYIDTSAWKPSRFPPSFVQWLRRGGRKKVLFGSNWPMIQPSACLAEVDGLELDDEARRMYLHDNAVRVYGLEASPS
jgi:predicted TIM-barrel fold metal-dependent hydrolase